MKKHLLIIFGTSVILFFLFVTFSYLVDKDLFTSFDFDTTVKLQDRIPRTYDSLFSFFSLIGMFEIALMFLLVLMVLFRKLKLIFALLFFGFFHVLELYGKTFVEHSGPPFAFLRTETFVTFPSSYVHAGYSYPSGHSGRAIFISVILGFLISKTKISRNKKYITYAIIFAFDFAMLLSRVYLGEHWSSDVIGGSLLGASLAVLSLLFL